MADFMSSVKTINSSVRTGMLALVLGGVGYGGYFGYENYVKPGMQAKQAMADLEDLQSEFNHQKAVLDQTKVDLAETKLANEKLATSLKLLKVDRRMANVEVIEMTTDDDGQPTMLVRFTEIDTQGNPVGAARDFTLAGDRMYIDCWIVSFDDKYIEEADELRATSLCVFKSIYGDIDGPSAAMSLDQESENSNVPGIYRDEEQNAFEQQIWGDFWRVCNDVDKQRELGIRASYGQANYVRAEQGKTYQVHLRSSGGASLRPIEISDVP